MSILYALFIEQTGIFIRGRFVDLLQQDLIIGLLFTLVVFKWKWWVKNKNR